MRNQKQLNTLITMAMTTLICTPAWADDSEVLLGTGNAQPNVMFIFDTSGSMGQVLASTGKTRMQTLMDASEELLTDLKDVNVGLMRYDTGNLGTNVNGGMVMTPVQDIETNRTTMISTIKGLKYAAGTPITETLYEAYQYFRGGPVTYGNNSQICTQNFYEAACNTSRLSNYKSVAASRVGGTSTGTNYNSPADQQCQKNFILFLTDGIPTSDVEANAAINLLPNSGAACSATTDGACITKLTTHMFNTDLRSSSLGGNAAVEGTQNVTTYFVAFGGDAGLASYFSNLDAAGKAGTTDGSAGGAYNAADADELATSFNAIFSSIDATTDPGASAASVAVNSFNKTQLLADLYVSVFEPTTKQHWPGNVKKYKLEDQQIVGKGGAEATDATTGFFNKNASSEDLWSTTSGSLPDYSVVSVGGAANVIPAYGSRNVYSYFGTSANLYDSANAVNTANTNLTSTVLGIGGGADPSRNDLINWARGQDVKDEDADEDNTDNRNAMGESIHSQPAVVIYGGGGSVDDAVVYMATNDGYLHAIDVNDGEEIWSFIPPQALSDLKTLYEDADVTSAVKHYGLDGDIRVLKYDINGDGEVSGDDKVFLYFSEGRGGPNYYALDVTNKTQPKLKWTLGSTELGKVQQSWSTPTLARIKVGSGSSQNTQKLVLIFGAGYDSDEETAGSAYISAGHDKGNAIYMVDAVNGSVLWSASNSGSNLNLSSMTHPIPSNVTVIDADSDGWSDRMYVGDLAGQLWRFDITNGNSVGSLVTGGVIASLGGKQSATAANNRSFFNAPDVAKFVVTTGSNYYNISIGSGDRSFPKSNTTTQDRFYMIRDYYLNPISSYTAITESNLFTTTGSALSNTSGATVTSIPNGTNGVMLPLTTGEKVLSMASTTSGSVLFTTYSPTGGNTCGVSGGTARAYALNVTTATKTFANLYETFVTTGIPTGISISDKTSNSGGSSSSSSSSSSGGFSTTTADNIGVCRSGLSFLNNCVEFGDKVKTFWQEAGAN
jgi:type IV pilus assembly protein PilY1